MQKRLVRKRDLTIALSKIEPHLSPKVYLEQYTISPEVAAEILYLATYTYNDVVGKRIVDLGCGTGRLSIGAVLLGAHEIVGIDIDRMTVKSAHKNAEKMGVKGKTQWIIGDIDVVRGPVDTVIMNPPFGTRVKHMDRIFLLKALSIAEVVYSLHKRTTRQYLQRFIGSNQGLVEAIFEMELKMMRVFNFHVKRKRIIEVDLYRIISTHKKYD